MGPIALLIGFAMFCYGMFLLIERRIAEPHADRREMLAAVEREELRLQRAQGVAPQGVGNRKRKVK